MTTILRARPVVEERTAALAQKISRLGNRGIIPKMRVILVGDDPASAVYVGHKQKMCRKLGCDFELVNLPGDARPDQFLKEIELMNNDSSVHGCFVQLPVPIQLRGIDVTELIAPAKDVDGFGAPSIVDLYKGKDPQFIPCTPKGIISLFDFHKIELSGKNIVVIGKSLIVGKPLFMLLQNRGATVTLCHSRTTNLAFHTQNADVVVSAVGKPRFLNRKHFRQDKSQILVDVGINKAADGKLCGDMDFENLKNDVKAITPVPGGIGPLTVLSLMENLVLAAQNQSQGN